MKKTIYISGIIIANLLLAGCLLKINHLPGGSIVLTLSLLLLSFLFLPLVLINHYKGQKDKNKKWLYIATFISFFMVFIAALFKVMHWPGASFLMLIGIPIPFILFLPIYIYHSVKDKEQPVGNFIAIILGLTFIAIYSGLMNVDVGKEILDHGIFLTKSNENVINYYESRIARAKKIDFKDEYQQDIIKVFNQSDEICSLIKSAKRELLDYTENQQLSTDLSDTQFNSYNINNIGSRNASQYILNWKEGALVPQIQDRISSYSDYLNTLNLSPELHETITNVLNVKDITVDRETITWIEREIVADYMIFALESLSRWEKNIRFVEYTLVSELAYEQKEKTIL